MNKKIAIPFVSCLLLSFLPLLAEEKSFALPSSRETEVEEELLPPQRRTETGEIQLEKRVTVKEKREDSILERTKQTERKITNLDKPDSILKIKTIPLATPTQKEEQMGDYSARGLFFSIDPDLTMNTGFNFSKTESAFDYNVYLNMLNREKVVDLESGKWIANSDKNLSHISFDLATTFKKARIGTILGYAMKRQGLYNATLPDLELKQRILSGGLFLEIPIKGFLSKIESVVEGDFSRTGVSSGSFNVTKVNSMLSARTARGVDKLEFSLAHEFLFLDLNNKNYKINRFAPEAKYLSELFKVFDLQAGVGFAFDLHGDQFENPFLFPNVAVIYKKYKWMQPSIGVASKKQTPNFMKEFIERDYVGSSYPIHYDSSHQFYLQWLAQKGVLFKYRIRPSYQFFSIKNYFIASESSTFLHATPYREKGYFSLGNYLDINIKKIFMLSATLDYFPSELLNLPTLVSKNNLTVQFPETDFSVGVDLSVSAGERFKVDKVIKTLPTLPVLGFYFTQKIKERLALSVRIKNILDLPFEVYPGLAEEGRQFALDIKMTM